MKRVRDEKKNVELESWNESVSVAGGRARAKGGNVKLNIEQSTNTKNAKNKRSLKRRQADSKF
jgi:hypothetical protein